MAPGTLQISSQILVTDSSSKHHLDGDADTMPTSRLIFAAIFLLALSPLAAGKSFAEGTSISITHSDIAAYKAALKRTPMQQVALQALH